MILCPAHQGRVSFTAVQECPRCQQGFAEATELANDRLRHWLSVDRWTEPGGCSYFRYTAHCLRLGPLTLRWAGRYRSHA